jgi:hypothetical protein
VFPYVEEAPVFSGSLDTQEHTQHLFFVTPLSVKAAPTLSSPVFLIAARS